MRKCRFDLVIDKTLYWSLMGIIIVSLLAFPICNYVLMSSYPETFSYKEWIWVVGAIALIWLIWKSGHGFWFGSFWISPIRIGFLFSNLVYITVLLTYDTQPASDWAFVWKAANEMANGQFADGVVKGTYMHEIPYQIGLAWIESFFIKVFGSTYLPLKLFNLVLLNMITMATYHFAKRKASYEVANYAYVAACMFLCYLMTVGQFTNHQLGFVFLYLSLYLYEKGRFLTCCCAGVMVALLNFVRPMGIMVVATIIIYTLFLLSQQVKKISSISNLLGFFVCYKLILLLLDLMLLNMNYTDEYVSRSTRNLYHKISFAAYESKIDGRIAEFDYDYEAYNKAYRAEIVNMVVNHPKEFVTNVVNKMIRYLGMMDYLFEMTYDHNVDIWQKYPIKAIYSIQWFQYVLFLIIALYGYIKYRKTHKSDIYQIFFIGNILVYFFVEAFSSYRFVNYFYLLFLVGYGYNEYYKSIMDRKEKQKA